MTQLEKTTTVPQLIKLVVDSGNTDELNKLIEQLKNISHDVFGEQVSLYEMYKNYFLKKLLKSLDISK